MIVSPVGVIAGALTLLFGAIDAADACEVRLNRSWASVRGGHGTIYMTRNGAPCGDIVYAMAAYKIEASALRLAAQPAHGEITIDGARFSYRPNPGFTGEDRFALVGTGVNRNGRLLRLRGFITVIVR